MTVNENNIRNRFFQKVILLVSMGMAFILGNTFVTMADYKDNIDIMQKSAEASAAYAKLWNSYTPRQREIVEQIENILATYIVLDIVQQMKAGKEPYFHSVKPTAENVRYILQYSDIKESEADFVYEQLERWDNIQGHIQYMPLRAYGYGNELVNVLMTTAVSPRKATLASAIESAEFSYYQQNGKYMPVTQETINWMINWVGAKDSNRLGTSEAGYVTLQMMKFYFWN